MKAKHLIWFLLSTLTLLATVAAQFLGAEHRRERLLAPNAGDLIPREIVGWRVEDLPLGQTPELEKTVDKVLQFDSAAYRVYRQGRHEIGVYVAYWLPGKIPPSLVDAHTPDICWVQNGWTMMKLPPGAAVHTSQGNIEVPNCREFTLGRSEVNVAYWHIASGVFRSQQPVYEGALPFWDRVLRRMKQVLGSVTQPPGEQIFVRIASDRPLAEGLATAPGTAALELVGRAIHGATFHRPAL